MICDDTIALLHQRLDGELDPRGVARFDAHIRGCPRCAAAYREQQKLRFVLRRSPRERASDQLHRRVRADIRASATGMPEPRPRWWGPAIVKRAVMAGSTLAIAATLIFVVASRVDDTLAREVVASHVRARVTDHLTDVAAADENQIKPWFKAKLDFSPPIVDLAQAGYPLIGGRLDYLGERTVAALVYRREKRVINLFVWPASEGKDTPPEALSQDGFHICHWQRAGMAFWAVSDSTRGTLEEFELLFRPAAKKAVSG